MKQPPHRPPAALIALGLGVWLALAGCVEERNLPLYGFRCAFDSQCGQELACRDGVCLPGPRRPELDAGQDAAQDATLDVDPDVLTDNFRDVFAPGRANPDAAP